RVYCDPRMRTGERTHADPLDRLAAPASVIARITIGSRPAADCPTPGEELRGSIMTQRIYTVRARNCEYRAAKPTLEAALIVAHAKVWQISPGEKVSIYRGTEL